MRYLGIKGPFQSKIKYGNLSKERALIVADAQGHAVALVSEGAFINSKNEATAKLFAAAPELLQACLKVIETENGSAPSVAYMDELKDLCRTAVKKALE